MIPKEKALEAYNMIKDYCKQQEKNCGNCLFETEDGCGCIFEFESVPFLWQQLDLD